MDKQFVKLSSLVDSEFTILSVDGYSFKKWDNENKRMLVSDNWQEGYRKMWAVTTNKGLLDLGSGQMGAILEAGMYNGQIDLKGKTYKVKSNGKTGMDIRYYFNPVKSAPPIADDPEMEAEIDVSSIPF